MARYSRQREIILQAVQSHPIHPSADEVYHIVKAENPNISLGTVYRNLNYLSENGSIVKILVPNSADRFDARTDEHYHMICSKCGRVYDLPGELESMQRVSEEIQSKTGIQCSGIRLLVEGICKNCQSNY